MTLNHHWPKSKTHYNLTGKAKQELNKFRRNLTQLSFPSQSARLVDLRNDLKTYLFGKSIATAVKPLQKGKKSVFKLPNLFKVPEEGFRLR